MGQKLTSTKVIYQEPQRVTGINWIMLGDLAFYFLAQAGNQLSTGSGKEPKNRISTGNLSPAARHASQSRLSRLQQRKRSIGSAVALVRAHPADVVRYLVD